MPEPAELLRAYAARAKKQFGQHFLTDPNLLDRIAAVGEVRAGDRVLEIGPGCGTLTSRLLKAGALVTAVEIDRDAAAFLREAFATENFDLVEQDALSVDFDELLRGHTWKVVANLPYNVGTQILFRLLDSDASIERMALMFQKEVADRIAADPGTKAYGALTLQIARRASVSVAMRVKPGAFTPPPKVDSAVLRVVPVAEPRIADAQLASAFDEVVTAGFAMRRKTLRNALGARFGNERAEAAIEDAGLDAKIRAERVDFDGFLRLATTLAPSDEADDGEEQRG